MSNAFISLFKDTAIASVIAVPELTYGANWISTNTFRIIEVYSVVTPMYLVTGWTSVVAAAPARTPLRVAPRMTAMLKALPFLWQGLLVTLQVSAIVVVVALVLGVLFGTALTYAPAVGGVAGARLQRHRARPAAHHPHFLRLLRHAGAQGECQRLVGGGRRARRLRDRPCRRGHARRAAIDPSRPD